MPYFPDKIKHAIGDDSMIYIDLIGLFCVFEMESKVSGISSWFYSTFGRVQSLWVFR